MVKVVCGRCQFCGKRAVLEVSSAMARRIDQWATSSLQSVQVAFPDLNAGQREMLISGSHPECFDKAFADE